MLDHRFGKQANDEVDCGVRDGMFDVQDGRCPRKMRGNPKIMMSQGGALR